jgi:hypothetical protein
MSDRNDWIPPESGEPDVDDDSGLLLFDPNEAVPDVEFEKETQEGHDSPLTTRIVVGAGVGIGVIALLALLLTRGPDAGEAAPEPTMAIPVPPAAARGTIILPVPDSLADGAVGTTVDISFRVTSGTGVPLPDTTLTFEVESGSGEVVEVTGVTDERGIASTTVALPRRPGTSVVRATLADSTVTAGRMTVQAEAGAPASISSVSGSGQQVPVGELLPNRVVVIVTDADGNPVPNAEIQFSVEPRYGLAAPTRTRTDERGQASALWRVGNAPGTQRLSAISSDMLQGVTFTATAVEVADEESAGDQPLETAPVIVARNQLAVGGSHVCVIRAGTVACRGGNERGQTGGNGSTSFIALTAGGSHTCGLDAVGVASCWGANDGGQLGDGSQSDEARPTRVRTELRFSSLSAGANHTCGLAGRGVPFCWGTNLNGQLGDGSRNDQSAPRTVGGGVQFGSLVAGWNHTCGLSSSGNAFCWGLNNRGQLGDGRSLDRLVPTLVRGSVETLVAGSAHTCGISDGKVLCWGANNFGQVGDGSLEDRTQPTEVAGLPGTPAALAAGAVHTCALVSGGRAYCWGQNLQGQLGDGSTENHARPVAVAGGLTFTQIRAGGAQTCGLTTSGDEYCWGQNLQGQLGDGTRVNRPTPTRVAN